MISLSVPNIITIALISLLALGLAKAGLRMMGVSPTWL